MNVYRLDPIAPENPSWRTSSEKGSMWAAAPSPSTARDLVAKLTALATPTATESEYCPESPWQDSAITSCVLEPSMTHIHD